MIHLDGSYGEGGGALVRTALALSVFTGKPFSVDKIRAGRKVPGLKPQHLKAIEALKEICGAEVGEVELGSMTLAFTPGKVKKGTYTIDIGTAGSITLLLQSLILLCMFAPGTVTLRVIGGTCGKWQAGVDYLQNILLPYLERFVEKIEMKILKRGYYPRGGGEVELKITPRWKLKDFDSYSALLEEVRVKTAKIALSAQGKLEQIRGVVNVSSELQEKEVGERIQRVCEGDLKKLGVPVNVRVDYVNSLSVGGEVLLWGVFSNNGQVDYDNPVLLGGDALIEKGKRSEEVGKEAVAELLEEVESEAAVDVHLADMLIPFMGLLCGSSIEVSSVSDHVLTNIYVVEKFLDVGFSVEGKRIRVEKC